MAESIISLYKHNSWSGHHGRRTKNNVHWILQLGGVGFAIAGMVVLFVERDVHFVSVHSQLGLASGVFTVLGVLNGMSALWAAEMRACVRPVYAKLCHNLTGSLAFVLGMVSLMYGFNLFPFRHFSPSMDVVVLMQSLCGLTIVASMLGAVQSMWSQMQGMCPGVCAGGDDDDGDSMSGFAAHQKGRA